MIPTDGTTTGRHHYSIAPVYLHAAEMMTSPVAPAAETLATQVATVEPPTEKIEAPTETSETDHLVNTGPIS